MKSITQRRATVNYFREYKNKSFKCDTTTRRLIERRYNIIFGGKTPNSTLSSICSTQAIQGRLCRISPNCYQYIDHVKETDSKYKMLLLIMIIFIFILL